NAVSLLSPDGACSLRVCRPNDREFLDGLSLVACHVGIHSSVSDGISCRHHRSPAAGGWPAGLGPEPGHRRLVELTHTTALLAPKCQSFPDNLIACFPASRSWNDHVRTEGNLLRCVSPLSGVKRTWALALQMSAFDPKRTSRPNPS